MAFINKLLKIAGKNDFHLSNEIGTSYILRLCWKYGWMLLRGRFFSLLYPAIDNTVFVGKKVTILKKSKLSVGMKAKLHDGVYIDALATGMKEQWGVFLGNYVVLGRNTRIECTGSLSNIGKGVWIGDRTTFGNDCFFGAAGGIVIGEDVVAGQFIRFHAENHPIHP